MKIDGLIKILCPKDVREYHEVPYNEMLHRMKLIEVWGIEEGARVLEIGCGQGEMLSALAYAVGENGFAHGIDIASPDYGSPETLGQARDRLMGTELGSHMRVDFDTDVLKDDVSFSENEFDYIVMAHCLWYLSSYEQLSAILAKVKSWGKKICIAEWNPVVSENLEVSQIYHIQAAQIQAICESFCADGDWNVRTMLYPAEIAGALTENGYKILSESEVNSPHLVHNEWEISITINEYPERIQALDNMPDKLKRLLIEQINELKKQRKSSPMSVHCIIAGK